MLYKLFLSVLYVMATVCFVGCNAPTKSEATYPCAFDLVGDFNQSQTILKINDMTLLDSNITIPNLNSSQHGGNFYPRAELIDIQLKGGSYLTHVEIEGIVKDTVLTINDTLFTVIYFTKDSSQIKITTSKYGPIIL
jgi:hypothetical protein